MLTDWKCKRVNIILHAVVYIHTCVNIILWRPLLLYYMAYVGCFLPKFWDKPSAPSSKAKQSNSSWIALLLKMGPLVLPEMSVTNYQPVPYNVPEE